ncbi:hypothetical protein FOH38_02075 [Lysinibacillus fusiformis]|nr:hypothetical protein FOH38_02075 [Lysinibacillus fusiformis]
MKERIFGDLIIKHRKSAIFFEIGEGEYYDCIFRFTEHEFKEFTSYIEEIANESWNNVTPKVADSMGTDYSEYYDKEFDNNGYLSIIENGLRIEGPYTTTGRLYKFNKAKIQSFIFDLRKKIGC